MTPRRRLRSALAVLAALAVVVAGVLVEQGGSGGSGGSAPQARAPRSAPDARALPAVTPAELPLEARRTLALIDRGGPFPYDRDGAVFADRERLLPDEPRGCYREYTVRTPGESDRGARRIVTSCRGPRYWSPDHYASFARVVAARL